MGTIGKGENSELVHNIRVTWHDVYLPRSIDCHPFCALTRVCTGMI